MLHLTMPELVYAISTNELVDNQLCSIGIVQTTHVSGSAVDKMRHVYGCVSGQTHRIVEMFFACKTLPSAPIRQLFLFSRQISRVLGAHTLLLSHRII
jgi:hypothetical protein